MAFSCVPHILASFSFFFPKTFLGSIEPFLAGKLLKSGWEQEERLGDPDKKRDLSVAGR